MQAQTKIIADTDQGNEDVTIIITVPEDKYDRGNLFWGTRQMFRDSFFTNAYDNVIEEWAEKYGYDCEIIEGYTPWKEVE